MTPCPRVGQHNFLRFLLNKETLKETLGLSHLYGIGAACLACYPLEKKALQTHGQGGWGEWKAEKTGGRAGSSADLTSGPGAQGSRALFWVAFSHGYSLCHQKPCPHSSPPRGGAAWRGSCHVANGRSWNGLAPSPTCTAATLRVRRRTSRGPDSAAPGCWDAGTPPRGQGTVGGAGGSPGAERVSAHVGNTGKGWRSGLPAEAQATGRSPYRRCRWGQAGVSRLSSPLLLSTLTVVFSVSGSGTQSREEAPLCAYSCECLSFLSLLPGLDAHSFSLPAPAPPTQGQFALSYPVSPRPSPPTLSSPLGWWPTLSSRKPALRTSASPHS